MNEKKICFVLCVNQEVFFEECYQYLERLIVPEGYEVEVMAVRDAVSMTSAYNEVMRTTDAKYKVFMHQDVFIVNRYLIEDILTIFAQDEQIGMIGMVGTVKMPEDGVMWHGPRCGNIYGSNRAYEGIPIGEYRYDVEKDGFDEVEAIDGLLMAVNGDIPWREDLFDGWDFYDVSQSFEYRKHHKKVVVPRQRRPWCVHNDGIMSLWNYDRYREIFLQHYKEYM